MPVAACITLLVNPILRPTRRRPAAWPRRRHSCCTAYESSTVMPGCRAVSSGTVVRSCSARASSSAIWAMSSAGSIALLPPVLVILAGLQLVAELVLALLPAGHVLLLSSVTGTGVGEPVGADGDRHLRVVGTGVQRLGVAVQVQHGGGLGVPGRDHRVAPPVTPLVVVHVP